MNKNGTKALAVAVIIRALRDQDYDFFDSEDYDFYAYIISERTDFSSFKKRISELKQLKEENEKKKAIQSEIKKLNNFFKEI